MERRVLLSCLACLAVGVQVPVMPNLPYAPAGTPFSRNGAIGSMAGRIGGFMKATADMMKHNHDEKMKNDAMAMKEKSVAGTAQGMKADLNTLKANLPQLRQTGLQLCGPDPVQLCKVRMNMYFTLAGKIEHDDPEVVPMLRRSLEVLQEFMQMGDNIHDAISSLTLRGLEERPPMGVKGVADINPRDGVIDRYELSEYMKTTYLFTLSDDAARALSFDQALSNRLKGFIAFDQLDAPPQPAGAPTAPAAPAVPPAAPQEAPTQADPSELPTILRSAPQEVPLQPWEQAASKPTTELFESPE